MPRNPTKQESGIALAIARPPLPTSADGIAHTCSLSLAVGLIDGMIIGRRRRRSMMEIPGIIVAGGVEVTDVDGVLGPSQVPATVLAAVAAEQFPILPHPGGATYERRRAGDRERWLRGMRRVQARLRGRP
jgi:hypothetical protein